MKRILTLVFCFSMFYHVQAQLPNGATAPDFTMTDLNGNVHHLYDYLDAGKTVILDFSATWCGPCWNYHNTHALRNIYDTYGPNGTDEVMVFFIEGDANTALACLYGNCPGTQGNWVAGTTYPIMNDHTSNSAYSIAFYPTIYGICPNGKITQLGQQQPAALYNYIQNCTILSYVDHVTGNNCYGENNGSITLNCYTGYEPYSFNWSNGATTNAITNLGVGTYTCTITGGNGDQLVTEPFIVPGPEEPVAATLGDILQENCFGNNGSAVVIGLGGTPPYNYQWSTGANTPAVTNLPAGTYSVTVDDTYGCGPVTQTVEIGYIPGPEAVIAPMDPLNCNNVNGYLDGTGSTSGPNISFEWITFDGLFFSGTNTLNPHIGSPGTYTLIITDSEFGCTSETYITVEGDFEEPVVNFPQANPTIPCGSASTQLVAQLGGNLNNFFIQWSTQNGNIQSGANTLTPTVTQAGTYKIRVENLSNTCYTELTITVTQAAEFAVTAVTAPEACAGQNNGSINVQVNGGTGPFNFNWAQSGLSGQNPTNLAPGQYTVSVSDNNGCQTVNTYTIPAATPIVVNSTVQNETDAGASDGLASVIVTGGTGPYTYLWSNGATTASITNISAGVYQVTVTDINGCTTVINVAVSNAGCAITATATVVEPKCSNSADGSVTINVQNGGAEVDAIWPDGQTGLTRNDLAAGSYNVIIEDESGCPLTILVEVKAPEAIQTIASVIPEFECASASEELGQLVIVVDGGTGALNVVWNTGQTGNQIMVPYGSYSAVITDESGCTATYNVTTLSSDEEAPVIATNEVTVYLDADGNAAVNAQMLNAGTTDNCGELVLSVSPSVFTCNNLGENDATFKASDLSGNAAEAAVIVTVVDNLAPAIQCPANIITNKNIVNYSLPQVEDNCNEVSLDLVSGFLPGSAFPSGVTNIVFIATDASGNTALCNFTVNVNRYGGGIIVNPDRTPGDDRSLLSPRNNPGTEKAFAFNAWPNPVSNTLYVSLKNMYSGATVSLMHISGKQMIENVISSPEDQILEIPVEKLVSGMYFIQIIENGTAHKQLIQINK
jgi:hypothetical protein